MYLHTVHLGVAKYFFRNLSSHEKIITPRESPLLVDHEYALKSVRGCILPELFAFKVLKIIQIYGSKTLKFYF